MAQIHNQSCEKNASTAYFPDEEYTNNAVLLAPNEFVKKLSLINLVEKLCKGTRRVYIVGDDIDREIYSQCGHVRMIPRTERSTNPNWLVAFKNRHGNKRFAEVYWEENNNLINVNNDPE